MQTILLLTVSNIAENVTLSTSSKAPRYWGDGGSLGESLWDGEL